MQSHEVDDFPAKVSHWNWLLNTLLELAAYSSRLRELSAQFSTEWTLKAMDELDDDLRRLKTWAEYDPEDKVDLEDFEEGYEDFEEDSEVVLDVEDDPCIVE